jgi:hypothetical protein
MHSSPAQAVLPANHRPHILEPAPEQIETQKPDADGVAGGRPIEVRHGASQGT